MSGELATGAITDPDAEAHRRSVGRVFPSSTC